MLPTSIAVSIAIVAAAGRDVAGLDRAHVHPVGLEVARGVDPAQVGVRFVGTGDVGVAGERRVLDDRQAAADGPEVADRAELRLDLLTARLAEVGVHPVAQLDLVEAVVAAHEDEDHPPALDDDRQGLDEGAGRQPEVLGDRLDLGQARSVDLLGRAKRRRQLDRLRLGRRHLDVGGVAGRQRHLVLAGRAGRHVLVGAGAAHHPDVGLAAVPADAAAIEDPLVGTGLQLVGAPQSLLVAVEGVGVLHRELAGAQDSGARARLVALLGLDVEEHQRQVAVGAHVAGHVGGDRLLVGHRQHHRRALAVLELEQLLDRVAPGLLPGLGRLQHRHQHLLAADRLHLLADDRLDLPLRPPPRRQVGPKPGSELADQPSPHHQLVRDRLRIRGRVLEGRQEGLGEAAHAAKPIRYARVNLRPAVGEASSSRRTLSDSPRSTASFSIAAIFSGVRSPAFSASMLATHSAPSRDSASSNST